jgi:type I restriction enzyme S subunit
MKNESTATTTGGRKATLRHIPPVLALSVGMPKTKAPKGWRWAPLTDLARLESGHTPSRGCPEYWGGDVPWLSIRDAKAHHGGVIEDTLERTTALGIANSSARILPKNTVCLSRTASVGYVVVMGRPMATSQDFVNWVCSKDLDHNFLKFLLVSEGKDLLRFASGSVHQTIYFPEAKAFHVCYPRLSEQQRIVGILDGGFRSVAVAIAKTQERLGALDALKTSLLRQSYRGEL